MAKRTWTARPIVLEQEELVKQIFAVNPHTVEVLRSSFPYAIVWSQHNLPAIVHMTHNSEEEGHALADVLFGDYSPAGRLNQTWPTGDEQLSPMMDYNIRHGRTYMYAKEKPLYAFGYGIDVVALEDYRAMSATDAYGIAEPSNIATAPAIGNAVYNAIGVHGRRRRWIELRGARASAEGAEHREPLRG